MNYQRNSERHFLLKEFNEHELIKNNQFAIITI